jgi:hypothetical protein
MDQRIPHELLHILLFQTTGAGFYNLPTWLSEGLASNAELYPNPDYHLLLDNAVENDTLLPISLLCETFPRDASNAILSYAQSASFTSYLYRTYGKSGLQDLVGAYANGLDCENGAQVAVGKSLSELDRNWQSEELSTNVVLSTMNNILPWLILLLTVLAVPVGIAISRARQKSDILSKDNH